MAIQPKSRAVKAALDQLWQAADRMTETESREMWSLLTALRGPDTKQPYETREVKNARIRTKHATTCQLRVASGASPVLLRKMGSIPRDIDERLLSVDVAEVERACGKHFADHVRDAINALGDSADEDDDTAIPSSQPTTRAKAKRKPSRAVKRAAKPARRKGKKPAKRIRSRR